MVSRNLTDPRRLTGNEHELDPGEENVPIIGYIIILSNKEHEFELSVVSTN